MAAFIPSALDVAASLEFLADPILLRDMSGNEKGEVLVGIIPTITASLLPRLTVRFAAR
jgi:hypothetical protein